MGDHELVLEAGVKGNGGEIFVFDMGKPVKIADLAQRMINLSGAKNVEIKYTGLRAGEKLYEEVLNDKEVIKRIEDHGADVETSTPEQLGDMVKSELGKWKDVVQKARLTTD